MEPSQGLHGGDEINLISFSLLQNANAVGTTVYIHSKMVVDLKYRSRVQVTAPSLNYQGTQISPNLMENFTFVKRLWLGDTYCCSFTCITCNNLYSDLWKSDLYFSPAIEQRSLWGPTEPRCIQSASLQSN